MYDLSQLEALDLVIKLAGFSRAAEKLRISQSAVSQRITALENAVGYPLLIRASPPRLTQAGLRYLQAFEQVNAIFRELTDVSRDKTQPVTLSVACNVESYEIWFNRCQIEASADLNVIFHTHLDDQQRTHLLLREGRALACVSSERGPFQGCTSEFLGTQVYRCVARPGFIEKNKFGKTLASKISNAHTVIYGPHDEIHDEFLCLLLKVSSPPPYLAHTVPSVGGMIEYVRQGAAYAVLPEALIKKELQDGSLVDLFPKCSLKVPLYWHRVDTKIPVLNQLTAHVLRSAAACL